MSSEVSRDELLSAPVFDAANKTIKLWLKLWNCSEALETILKLELSPENSNDESESDSAHEYECLILLSFKLSLSSTLAMNFRVNGIFPGWNLMSAGELSSWQSQSLRIRSQMTKTICESSEQIARYLENFVGYQNIVILVVRVNDETLRSFGLEISRETGGLTCLCFEESYRCLIIATCN